MRLATCGSPTRGTPSLHGATHGPTRGPARLAAREIRTIEAYRGQPDAYWFPTVAELEAALEDAFVLVERHFPSYEMGDRCPTYLFRRR